MRFFSEPDPFLDSPYDDYEREEVMGEKKINHLRDTFSEVLDLLYSKKKLKNEDLDYFLGEIAYTLGVEMPALGLTIERMDIRELTFIDHIKLAN